MNTQTALQVTDFNFYGDELIALKDNATGEIYTAITHILRGIGFNSKQVEHQQSKILKDELLKSHTLKFSGVDLNMPSVNEIWCISQRKLPIALAKINITPKMKKRSTRIVEKTSYISRQMCGCISFRVYRPQNCFRYEYATCNRDIKHNN